MLYALTVAALSYTLSGTPLSALPATTARHACLRMGSFDDLMAKTAAKDDKAKSAPRTAPPEGSTGTSLAAQMFGSIKDGYDATREFAAT